MYWFAAQVAGDRRQHEVPLSALAGTAAQQVDATWANVSCGPPLCACAPKPKKTARKKKATGGKKPCSAPGAQDTGSGSSDDSDGGSAGARRDKCPGDSKVTLVLSFDFSSSVLSSAFRRGFALVADKLVYDFGKRADDVYGT